jgi:hypothetical protein
VAAKAISVAYDRPALRSIRQTPDQRALDVVDSYSMSVSLTLSALGFLRVFRREVTRETLRREIDDIEQAARRRLTAAMVGLLRSFTVNVFEPDSPPGQVLRRNINQAGLSDRRVLEDLQDALKPLRASLVGKFPSARARSRTWTTRASCSSVGGPGGLRRTRHP